MSTNLFVKLGPASANVRLGTGRRNPDRLHIRGKIGVGRVAFGPVMVGVACALGARSKRSTRCRSPEGGRPHRHDRGGSNLGARGKTRRYEALDLPLAARPREAADSPRPKEARATLLERPDGTLSIDVPRPGMRIFASCIFFSVLTLLFFSTPVLAISALEAWPTALMPHVVIFATAIKLGLGYCAHVEASPTELIVHARGLFFNRRVAIPSTELESLHFAKQEWGGPRNAIAHLMDGLIVARSDHAAIRFGYGLSRGELEHLAMRLRSVLTSSPAAQRTLPPRPLTYQ